jgi:glucokinase
MSAAARKKIMKELIAGIDIGGTKIAIALATPACGIVAQHSFPTQVGDGPHKIMERTLGQLDELIKREEAVLSRVGVACAGPLDTRRGVTVAPPNLPGWHEFPVVEIVRERIGVPVAFDNDANAAALAELRFGAGRGLKNLVYVTVSTGIGGGVIVDGKLVHGITGNAGEIGHLTVLPNGPKCGCGARGCLEAVCSGTGIARRLIDKVNGGASSLLADRFGNIEQVTAKNIAEAAAEGDPLAGDIWEETVFYLSIGLGNIIVMFEPEAIILGGGVAMTGEQLFRPLRRRIAEQVKIFRAENIKILHAGLGAESGIYGALALAAEDAGNPAAPPV